MSESSSTPFFSVVLANYNGSRYLSEAIQSVLDQDYADYEFIVVDDGSTDDSPAIVRDFAERHPERIRAILKTENEGQGESFNKGVAASKGRHVCFIDSDDVWFPEKLTKLAEFIERSRGSSIYQHNLYKWVDGEITTNRFRTIVIAGDVLQHTRDTRSFPLFIPTSGLTFPRAVLDKVLPIPKGFRTCADGYLTRTAFVHGPVAFADECWGYYRIHGGNNVFANANHNRDDYRYGLLVPALNAYYKKRGIKFRFADNSLKERIKNLTVGRAYQAAKRRLKQLIP